MICKNYIFICIVIMLIPIVLAQELEIELKPHYFSKGYEVDYTDDIEVSGIKFEIIGKNNNQTSRILDIMVLDSNIFFPNETRGLRIKQTKSLFMSDLINVTQLNVTQLNLTYFVKVFGLNEKTDKVIYANDSVNITIENKLLANASKGVLANAGESIYPSNPKVGLFIGSGIICCIGFVLWKYEVKSYLDVKSYEWKVKNAQKRKESYEGEEGW